MNEVITELFILIFLGCLRVGGGNKSFHWMDVKTKINTFLKNKQNRDSIFKSAHLDKIITDTD